MNNWQKLCDHIDQNENFSIESLKPLAIPPQALDHYRSYLKKAGFIKKVSTKHYIRLKTIGALSIYQVKEIGYELEK